MVVDEKIFLSKMKDLAICSMPYKKWYYRMTLYNKTLELIQNRSVKLKLVQIAKDTGLSESWLQAFSYGDIPDPSVNKIQKLYEYLTKNPLQI
jgi:hypothetical protein